MPYLRPVEIEGGNFSPVVKAPTARASKPIRPVDSAGTVIRKAIERISGERAQIGDAAGHPGRGGRDRVVTVGGIVKPVPPRVVACVIASMVALRGMLSDPRIVRSGFYPKIRRGHGLSERGSRRAWRGRWLRRRVRAHSGKRNR